MIRPLILLLALGTLAHADERRDWLNRYTVHPQHCPLVTNPDDGLVSGPTPQVCAPPEALRYPPGDWPEARETIDPQWAELQRILKTPDDKLTAEELKWKREAERILAPPSAGRGLLDPMRPERSFAR
jgi:hypothetical protein